MNKYVGERFETNHYGTIEVVDYIDSRHIDIVFLDTGYETTTRLDKIKSGSIRDRISRTICNIGFVGDGIHSTRKGGRDAPEYQCWVNMIKRCYDDDRSYKNKSYDGCTVSEEWHCFQDFADWYKANHPQDGKKYHLDKDMLVDGNKIYSPETCCFLTPRQNSIISNQKKYRITTKHNQTFCVVNMADWCRENGYSKSAMSAMANGKRSKHYDIVRVVEL